MRRNSVTPLASPEPTKKPRINSFEEHVASTSAALPNCLPPEVPAQLPGQVRDPLFLPCSRVSCLGGEETTQWVPPRPQTQAGTWVVEGANTGTASEVCGILEAHRQVLPGLGCVRAHLLSEETIGPGQNQAGLEKWRSVCAPCTFVDRFF